MWLSNVEWGAERTQVSWLSFSHPWWRCLHQSGLFRLRCSPGAEKVPPGKLKQSRDSKHFSPLPVGMVGEELLILPTAEQGVRGSRVGKDTSTQPASLGPPAEASGQVALL